MMPNVQSEKITALIAHLESNVWPLVPPEELGRVMTREEEDQILGFGPAGV
jgi:antitoxin VapB